MIVTTIVPNKTMIPGYEQARVSRSLLIIRNSVNRRSKNINISRYIYFLSQDLSNFQKLNKVIAFQSDGEDEFAEIKIYNYLNNKVETNPTSKKQNDTSEAKKQPVLDSQNSKSEDQFQQLKNSQNIKPFDMNCCQQQDDQSQVQENIIDQSLNQDANQEQLDEEIKDKMDSPKNPKMHGNRNSQRQVLTYRQDQNSLQRINTDISQMLSYEESLSIEYFSLNMQNNLVDGQRNKKSSFLNDLKLYCQGYLLKQSGNIFLGYQKRYFVLYNDKLLYFQSEEQKLLKGIVNFKLAKIDLIANKKKKTIQLKIENCKKDVLMKALNDEHFQKWVDAITSILNEFKGDDNLRKHHKVSKANIAKYINDSVISEHDYLEEVKTGDILLFNTNSFGAKLQRYFAKSKYDHVAMVLNLQGQIYVLDSQYDKGVALTQWDEFIFLNDLYQKVYFRKLFCKNQTVIEEQLLCFINESIGKKYDLSLNKLLKKNSLNNFYKADSKNSGKNANEQGYFCSELVAAAYKKAGLLHQKKSSSSYWPTDFSSERKLQLLNQAYLEPEKTIILCKDLEYNKK